MNPLAKTPSRQFLSLGIFIFVALVLAIGILSNTLRLPHTPIELIVETTDLSFTAPEDAGTQNLVENLRLADIGFGDVSSVQIGSRRPITLENGASFPIKLTKQPGTEASLVLEQFNLPRASTLHLNVVPLALASDHELVVSRNQIQFAPKRLARVNTALVRCGPAIGAPAMPETTENGADCDYQLEIELNGAESIDATTPATLELSDGSLLVSAALFRNTARMLAFDFETTQERLRVASQVQIADISFRRAEAFSDANDTSYRIGSGIESGTLYLEDLGGREIHLRPGEDLSLKIVEGGLRAVDLGSETMTVQFSGHVDSLMTGERNLMPTLFKFWFENDTFKAILAAISGIITTTIALGTWLLPRDQGPKSSSS